MNSLLVDTTYFAFNWCTVNTGIKVQIEYPELWSLFRREVVEPAGQRVLRGEAEARTWEALPDGRRVGRGTE